MDIQVLYKEREALRKRMAALEAVIKIYEKNPTKTQIKVRYTKEERKTAKEQLIGRRVKFSEYGLNRFPKSKYRGFEGTIVNLTMDMTAYAIHWDNGSVIKPAIMHKDFIEILDNNSINHTSDEQSEAKKNNEQH